MVKRQLTCVAGTTRASKPPPKVWTVGRTPDPLWMAPRRCIRGNCSDRYNSTCTSFDGIRLTTVEGAETLKSYTGCALNITGGTETGHASGTYSHWNGHKLDYSLDSCVSNYITSAFTYIGPRAGDGAAMYRSGSGNIYAHEGSHWDVVCYNCGGC